MKLARRQKSGGEAANQGQVPRSSRRTIRFWVTAGSLLALVIVAALFAVALTAAVDSSADARSLSGRLIPAQGAANDQLTQFTSQQVLLRNAVAAANAHGLPAFRDAFDAAGNRWQSDRNQLDGWAAGDPPLKERADTSAAAYQAWLTIVADPQLAALTRGDFARAAAIAARSALVTPRTTAVRVTGLALSAHLVGEQQAASASLTAAQDTLLGALIAMIVTTAAMAVAVFVGVRRAILKPFSQLEGAVAAVAEGQYQRRIPTVGNAELADVSRGIERMRTRLVDALAERERAEGNLRRVFDLAPDAMVGVAQGGEIVMANAQAVQLFGYAVHEMIGSNAVTLVPEEWRADLIDDTASNFADRRSKAQWNGATAAGLRKDGSTFPAEVRLSLLPTDGATVIIAAIRDVSERVAIEAERERLRVAAEGERAARRQQQSQRLESLGQLVGGVAHDFNNLLNVISGYADFTAETLHDLAGQDERLVPVLADVQEVRTAAQQAIRVTRQLLTFSRSDQANREILDLNEVVDSAGQLLRRSLGERIDLGITTEPDLWPVAADRGQLEQVLVNLALNARDAMPGGGRLTISTTNTDVDAVYAEQRPHLEPGRYCRLAVSDTGTGMDAETIERVFEPFFSTKPRSRGTGLGLATVYGIVSGLGGTIDIYSEVGFGTTMNVLLPAAALPEGTAQRGDTEQPGNTAPGTRVAQDAAPAEAAPRPGETILLVEDEESLRTMASRILARNGYQVREAPNGESALRIVADPAVRVDLLVTDMVMPGMLGNEVVDRARELRPALPAVFITGYAPQVLDFHGIPAPQLDIVQKPFTESDLLGGVQRALTRAAVPRQAGPAEAAPLQTAPLQTAPPQAEPDRAGEAPAPAREHTD